MSYQQLAFFMGFFGSLHCVAMCGPLMLALPGAGGSKWMEVFNRVLYQVGRVVTYGLLGFLIGLIGHTGSIKGWQQAITIGTGVVLIGMGVFNLLGAYIPALSRKQQQCMAPIVRLMGRWLHRPGGSFMVGMLNGLLPCGMVYMALASAVNADSLRNSFLFMTMFGFGTLPLLFVFSFAGEFSKPIFKKGFNRLLPFLYMLMGGWFILRGANLDIPYLSPLLYMDGAINCA